ANAAPQPAITWPAAKDILVSTGTSSNPTGEAAFTYDTAVNLFRLDGYQGIGVDPGTIADGKVVLAVQGNASQDRIYLRPGGIQLTASGSYAYVDVDPASTSIVTGGGGITLPVLATMRLRSAPWTGGGSGGATIPEMATLYIDGAPGVPAASPTLSLAMHVASGYSRFDGTVQWGQGTTIVVSGSTEIGPVNDGNLHHVNGSGSPVITGFTSGSSHRPGEVIILVFDNACTVKHLGTGTVQIYLRSGADLSAVANDTLMLVNDGTYWNQI
ncbi:MAG TPA: hypothetical protein VLZ78_02595, partial [Terrimesophilobacter sp.]|nr:hypothetical protein [Terrimesophilobacter sp.]